jgi:hypothetical protein
MVCPYNKLLAILKNEGNSDTCYDIDGPCRHYAEWNEPIAKGKIPSDTLTWGNQNN